MKSYGLTMIGILLLVSHFTEAASIFTLHQQGWHWYAMLKKEDKSADLFQETVTTVKPKAQLAQITNLVENARAQAVLQPTSDNVARYIVLQNVVTANAAVFANVWQQVLWQYPTLNYRLQRPTDQVGQAVFRERQANEREQLLLEAAKTMGLVFIFSDTCPYCQRFAPTLKAVTKRYPFAVFPVSITGKGLPDYPQPQLDKGLFEQFGITQVPAVLLVEPATEQVQLVSLGLQSETGLIERLTEVVKAVQQTKEVPDEAK